jgi:hypothetical protein
VRGGRKGFRGQGPQKVCNTKVLVLLQRDLRRHTECVHALFVLKVKPRGVPCLASPLVPFFCVGVKKVGAAQWSWRQAASLLQELFQQAHAHELARRRRTHQAVTCCESLLYGGWSIDAAC